MRAHARAVAWREHSNLSPAKGTGTGFQLFVRRPQQMQTASEHIDFISFRHGRNAVEGIHDARMRTSRDYHDPRTGLDEECLIVVERVRVTAIRI
jgi:hypothetical protein